MSTVPAQASVKNQEWIKPFDKNYNVTQKLWNKETSSNTMLSAVQKVVYFMGAAFTVVFETLANVLKAVANGAIGGLNKAHNYFAKKEVVQVATENKTAETITAEKATTTETVIAAVVVQQEAPLAPVEENVVTNTVTTTEQEPVALTKKEKVKALANWAATTASTNASKASGAVKGAFQSAKNWATTPASENSVSNRFFSFFKAYEG